MAEKPERRLRHLLREQSRLSIATDLLGAGSLVILFGGTAAVITAGGWTPPESFAEALTSRRQLVVLLVALVLGLMATALGFLLFRRMATRVSREASVAGAVLGSQSVLVAALILWIRSGDVEVLARNLFDLDRVGEFADRFVQGAFNTLILALSGEGLGIALGLGVAVFALSRRAVVRAPARAFINFFRGTPLLWQLIFGYFGIVLGLRLELSVYEAAILIIGLNSGAYSAEIFRAGIQSVERAQLEAARSLGMSYLQALRYVILPQAFRRVIPPLTNEFVILVKDTSLVSVLGVTFAQQELLAVGREIYATSANASALLGTAAGYLVITLPMIAIVTRLERRLRSGLTIVGM